MFGEMVEFDDVLCKAETDKAIKVIIEGTEEWIPKTHVSDDSEVYKKDDEGRLIITKWLAEQKGLL